MAVTTIKASLVGMRYNGLSTAQALRHLAGSPELRRDRSNDHDDNAVAVMSGNKMLGYIDRVAAAMIAPLLDGGATSQVITDVSRPSTAVFVPLTVTIERDVARSEVPKACESGIAGIYRISVGGLTRSYVGQSLDVQNRIAEHWFSLARGIHPNPELQRIWRAEGPAAFRPKLQERAPKELAGFALAHWLVERERAWVENYGGLRNSINARWPQIVLDDRGRAELEQERRRCAGELTSLDREFSSLTRMIAEERERAGQLKQLIRGASGILALFVSMERKRKASLARRELPDLERRILALETETLRAQSALQDLQRQLHLI